jgi:hypothetical protein
MIRTMPSAQRHPRFKSLTERDPVGVILLRESALRSGRDSGGRCDVRRPHRRALLAADPHRRVASETFVETEAKA